MNTRPNICCLRKSNEGEKMGATVVGFLNLETQLNDMEKRIETAIRSSWLDSQTAFEFKKEFQYKMKKRDVKQLESLLVRINHEISWRRRTFGIDRAKIYEPGV